jgi:hypothetical protein
MPTETETQTETTPQEELVDFKIANSDITIKIPKQAQIAIGKNIENTRKAIETQTKEKLLSQFNSDKENLSKTIEQLQAEVEESRLAKMSAEERAATIVKQKEEKYAKDLSAKEQEAANNYNLFVNHKINTDILTSLPSEVMSSEQALILFKAKVKTEVKKVDNDFKSMSTMLIDGVETELPTKDAVLKWISYPENENLLKTNLRSGGNTPQGGRKLPDGSIAFNNESLGKDPKARKEFLAKLQSGDSPQIQ